MFDMLKSTSSIFFPFYYIMKAISSTHHSTIISLLQEGYSVRQIETKTGIGRSTIGRVKKGMDRDKENNKGGQPAKLSSRDQQAILRQITTGQLDNAVQASQFITNITSTSVTPQTVRNMLKANHFWAIVKRKCPLLKQVH